MFQTLRTAILAALFVCFVIPALAQDGGMPTERTDGPVAGKPDGGVPCPPSPAALECKTPASSGGDVWIYAPTYIDNPTRVVKQTVYAKYRSRKTGRTCRRTLHQGKVLSSFELEKVKTWARSEFATKGDVGALTKRVDQISIALHETEKHIGYVRERVNDHETRLKALEGNKSATSSGSTPPSTATPPDTSGKPVPDPDITVGSDAITLKQGDTSDINLTLGVPPTKDYTLVATSSDTGVLEVVTPAVPVKTGQTVATVRIKGIVPGNTTLTLNLGNSIKTLQITVEGAQVAPPPAVGAVQLSKIAVDPAEPIVGQSAKLTITLTGPAPAGGAVVTLKSDVTDVLEVPATVTIPEGKSSTMLDITLKKAGLPKVTAVYSGSSAEHEFTVKEAPKAGALVTPAFPAQPAGSGFFIPTWLAYLGIAIALYVALWVSRPKWEIYPRLAPVSRFFPA